MRCVVKLWLHKIDCPGTLHLNDRRHIYLQVGLFGRIHHSEDTCPSFPVSLSSKVKFQRLFVNAKSPDQVLDLLEDETITIELKQRIKNGKAKGKTLATFEGSVRCFLFPAQSFMQKDDNSKREVLLQKTDMLLGLKMLDPQLVFSTRTTIEETPFRDTKDPQMSRSLRSTVISPTFAAVTPSTLNINRSTTPVSLSETARHTSPSSKHCICACPTLNDTTFSLSDWLDSISIVLEHKKKKPFRVGNAPESLLAKQLFENKVEQEASTFGLCDRCLIPSKNCSLCSAYVTVFGKQQFLQHRFLHNKSLTSAPNDQSNASNHDNVLCSKKENNCLLENSHGRAYSEERRRYRATTATKVNHFESVTSPLRSSTRLDGKTFMDASTSTGVPQSHLKTPREVRRKVKELMKKNNSVLQYELSSSSDSNVVSEDDVQSDESFPDVRNTCCSHARNVMPARSVVTPSKLLLRLGRTSPNDVTRRDVFDSSLKSVYKDLYERTSNY